MHPFCNILIPKLFMTLAVQFHKLLSFSILGDLLIAIQRVFINRLFGDTKSCKPSLKLIYNVFSLSVNNFLFLNMTDLISIPETFWSSLREQLLV